MSPPFSGNGSASLFAKFLIESLVVLAGLLVLLALAITLRRALRLRHQRRDVKLTAPVRRLLLEVVAEDDPSPEGLERLAELDRRTWSALEPTVVSLLSQVRGASRQALADLLVRRSGEARILRRSRRPGSVGRARAADLLGAAGTPEAVTELIRMLNDRDPDVRAVATRALGRAADPAGTDALIAGLSAHRGLQPSLVAYSLVRIGTPAVPGLVAAMTHPNATTRIIAAETLGLLGAIQAVNPLVDAVQHDPRPEVQVRAAVALGRIGAPSATEPLLARLAPEEPHALRAAAARALGDIGDLRTIAPLRNLVADADLEVAKAAAGALGALGPSGSRALHDLADDDHTRAPHDPQAGRTANPTGEIRVSLLAQATLAQLDIQQAVPRRPARVS